jgi:hypothetical protein
MRLHDHIRRTWTKIENLSKSSKPNPIDGR